MTHKNFQTELLDRYTPSGQVTDASAEHVHELGAANASFTWYNDVAHAGDVTPSRASFRLRIEQPLVFAPGKLNLIVGPTGSGKTSMLMALLGEMHYVPSGPSAWVNLPREGGVAYCAQESWVQSLTIRDNILFGKAYDEARYKKGELALGLHAIWRLIDVQSFTNVASSVTLRSSMPAILRKLVRRA
jgi:ABC-type multidrug transport system fused ATPase/permease subunit